jgi:hypothetical protein
MLVWFSTFGFVKGAMKLENDLYLNAKQLLEQNSVIDTDKKQLLKQDLEIAKTLGFDKVSHEDLLLTAASLNGQVSTLEKTLNLYDGYMNRLGVDQSGLASLLNDGLPVGLLNDMVLTGMSLQKTTSASDNAKKAAVRDATKALKEIEDKYKAQENQFKRYGFGATFIEAMFREYGDRTAYSSITKLVTKLNKTNGHIHKSSMKV